MYNILKICIYIFRRYARDIFPIEISLQLCNNKIAYVFQFQMKIISNSNKSHRVPLLSTMKSLSKKYN